MRIEKIHLKDKVVNSTEDAVERLREALEQLNGTREGKCWICDAITDNWGVLFPERIDGLGLGVEGEATRLAFFPVCPEHNLNDDENGDLIIHKFAVLRKTLVN